jgi:hypothetical protein
VSRARRGSANTECEPHVLLLEDSSFGLVVIKTRVLTIISGGAVKIGHQPHYRENVEMEGSKYATCFLLLLPMLLSNGCKIVVRDSGMASMILCM